MRYNWRLVKASDVIDFNPREHISKNARAKKVAMENLIPFTRDISGYEIAPFSSGSKFRNGDTIMARITPCLENGKTAQVSILNENEVGFGSTEFIVLRAKPGISDKDFVYYLSLSPIIRNRAIKSMVGSSGRQRVQQDVLNNIELYLPSLQEQIEIGKTLSLLDDKIAINNKINDYLEQIAQAIYKTWFIDFEPFQSNGFVETELGVIPKGWKIGCLNDIADIIMGQSPKGTSYNGNGNGIVFYQGRSEFGNRFPTRCLFTIEPKRIAQSNDVLLSVRAPVGDINIAYEDCCIGRGLSAIRSKHGYSSFILYTMQSLQNQLNVYNGEGTVFGSINKNDLHALSVIIPPEKVIQTFENLVQPIDKEIRVLYEQNYRLQEARDMLLPKLMSGELSMANL